MDDRRQTKDEGRRTNFRRSSFVLRPLLDLPGKQVLAAVLGEGQVLLLAEADEIVEGRVRLFGGEPVPLRLEAPGPLEHWTVFEQGFVGAHGVRPGAGEKSSGDRTLEEGDIKFIWEPGRFGWVYTLGRAYLLTGEERFARAFWEYCEAFLDANPTNLGPHWASGQEVALRLMAFAFADQVFAGSKHSTEQRRVRLAEAAAAHALRIPPTLAYARAQNNNHLLTEAVGLYTAGAALAGHPRAEYWRDLGWRLMNAALQSQIDGDGTYIQHSTNYHRLMLQAALWAERIAQVQGQRLPEETCQKLAAAARWLLALHDPGSGRVPNLGPNDGADILPLSICSHFDFRPVLQAACLAFTGERAFPSGPWDELGLWLGVEGRKVAANDRTSSAFARSQVGQREILGPAATGKPQPQSPIVLRLPKNQSWAYLRAARFTDRPGHADQLHLDLWWRGLNVAQDAGTYLYNAPPPWENALARTAVHNTVSLNGTDQMTRAGRFLWLDLAQAQGIEWERAEDGAWERSAAQHNGYRKLNAIHRREVTAHAGDRWTVSDRIFPSKGSASVPQPVNARLHWLLPDWEWRIEIGDWRLEINLQSPEGLIRLQVGHDPQFLISNLYSPIKYQVVRAGELLHGDGPISPTWGWASPTYGVKIPALSISISVERSLPIHLLSEWIFPSS